MSDDLIIPGRMGRDFNVVQHWWTFEDLSGVPFTSFDMFFGTLQGGTTGMNPVMDKHYKLENVGIMLRHISPFNQTVTVNYRRNENPTTLATFAFTTTNNTGGANKACGTWSRARPRPPCGSYNIHITVGGVGIAFIQMTLCLTWKVVSDAP
jgi:hypothetical protein